MLKGILPFFLRAAEHIKINFDLVLKSFLHMESLSSNKVRSQSDALILDQFLTFFHG
jgi:hypothetical protein